MFLPNLLLNFQAGALLACLLAWTSYGGGTNEPTNQRSNETFVSRLFLQQQQVGNIHVANFLATVKARESSLFVLSLFVLPLPEPQHMEHMEHAL